MQRKFHLHPRRLMNSDAQHRVQTLMLFTWPRIHLQLDKHSLTYKSKTQQHRNLQQKIFNGIKLQIIRH